MLDDKTYRHLLEELAVAELKADLISCDPGGSSPQDILDSQAFRLNANKITDDTIRRDFHSMPPQVQSRMVDLLVEHGEMSRDWWLHYLLLK